MVITVEVGVDMARIEHEPFEVETGSGFDETGETDRLRTGRDAAAAGPQIDLHVDGDPGAVGGASGRGDGLAGVEADRNSSALQHCPETPGLALADGRIGEHQVVQPGFAHDFGLAQLGDRDAAGSHLQLLPGQTRHLVGLDVRP